LVDQHQSLDYNNKLEVDPYTNSSKRKQYFENINAQNLTKLLFISWNSRKPWNWKFGKGTQGYYYSIQLTILRGHRF